MTADPRDAALAYLAAHHVMTLATHDGDDLWAAAVFYVNEGFDLFFLSAPHTRHARHLAASGRAAATIQEDYHDWTAIKGVQLEGAVHALAGEAQARAIHRYQARFPFLRAAPAAIQAALGRVTWYRLAPTRVYFVDNSRGFGHRDQVL